MFKSVSGPSFSLDLVNYVDQLDIQITLHDVIIVWPIVKPGCALVRFAFSHEISFLPMCHDPNLSIITSESKCAPNHGQLVP